MKLKNLKAGKYFAFVSSLQDAKEFGISTFRLVTVMVPCGVEMITSAITPKPIITAIPMLGIETLNDATVRPLADNHPSLEEDIIEITGIK